MSFPLSGTQLGPTVNGNDINSPLSHKGNWVRTKVDENLSQNRQIFLQIKCNYKEVDLLYMCVDIYTRMLYVSVFYSLISEAGLCLSEITGLVLVRLKNVAIWKMDPHDLLS